MERGICPIAALYVLRITLINITTAVVGRQQQPSALNGHHLRHITSPDSGPLDLLYMVSDRRSFKTIPRPRIAAEIFMCQTFSQAYFSCIHPHFSVLWGIIWDYNIFNFVRIAAPKRRRFTSTVLVTAESAVFGLSH